jgi:predicted phage terminase large subunit-like protein
MGGYASVGVGGGLTGKGADLLILDDLYKDRQDADSESYRKMVEEWFRSTAYTRIQPGGGCLVLFTRWHEADLGGVIEDTMQHEGFKILRFSAVAEHDEPPYRLAGESINPLRRSAEDYLRIKRTVGMREWQCLYQQDPVPADGTMFKLSDVRYYDKDIEDDTPDLKRLPDREDLTTFSAWDLSTGRSTDFTVGGVAAIDRDYNLYLIDVKRGKWSSFDIAEKIIDTAIEHKTQRNGMEQGQLSAMIEPILNKRMQERQKFINISPLKPGRQNKVARSMTIHARMQQGKVFLPKNAPWVQDFLAELMKFPNGRNDDQVDVLAYLGLMINDVSAPAKAAPKPQKGWREKIKKQLGGGNSWMSS